MFGVLLAFILWLQNIFALGNMSVNLSMLQRVVCHSQCLGPKVFGPRNTQSKAQADMLSTGRHIQTGSHDQIRKSLKHPFNESSLSLSPHIVEFVEKSFSHKENNNILHSMSFVQLLDGTHQSHLFSGMAQRLLSLDKRRNGPGSARLDAHHQVRCFTLKKIDLNSNKIL